MVYLSLSGMAGLLAVVTASEEDYNNLAAAISNAEGATDDMASKMRDTLKSDLILAKSAAEGLALSFGEALEPAARSLVQGLTSLLDKFNAMSDSTKKALIYVTAAGVGFGTFFTTLGAASKGFSALVKSYNTGLGIFRKLGDSIGKADVKMKLMRYTTGQTTVYTKRAATASDTLSRSNSKVAKSSGTAAKSLISMKSAAIIGGVALVALIGYIATADNRLKELNKSLIDGIKQSGENIKTHTSDIESAKSKMAEIETLQKQLDNTKDKESRIQLEKDLVAKKQELIEIMPEVAEGLSAEESSQRDLNKALGDYMDLKQREIEFEKRKQSSQAREFIRENKMTGKKADSTLYSAGVADKNIKAMEKQLKEIEHLQDATTVTLGNGKETTVKNYRDNINARLIDYGKQYQEQYDLALQAYEAYSALDPKILTKDQKEYMKNFENMKEYTKDIKDSVSKVPELKIDVGSAKSSKKAIQELVRDVKESTKNFETLPKTVKGSMKTLVGKVEDGTITVEDFKNSMVEFEHASKQSFGKSEKAAKKSMDKLLDSFSKGELTVKEFNDTMKSTANLNKFSMEKMSKSAQKGLGKLVERFNNSEIPVKDFSRSIESMSKLGSMNIESFSKESKSALDKLAEDFSNNTITLGDFESRVNQLATFASIDMSNMSSSIKTYMDDAVLKFATGNMTVEEFKNKLDGLSIASSIDMSNLSSNTSSAINNMTLKFIDGQMSADNFQRGVALAASLTKTNLQGLSQEQQSTIGTLIQQFNDGNLTVGEFQTGVVSALSGVQLSEADLSKVHAQNMALFVDDVLKAKGSAEGLQTAISNLQSKTIRLTYEIEQKNVSGGSTPKAPSKPKENGKKSISAAPVKARNLNKNQILSRNSEGETSTTLATKDTVQTTRTSSADGKAPATSGSTTPVEIVEEVNVKTTRAKSSDDAEREREEAARKKEEMESNAISKIQDLRNKLAEALRKKIEEQKKHELKVLDEKLKAIEDNYNKQKKLAEDATNAKIEALNKEKEALNEEREEDYQAKVDALKKEKAMWEQNDSALAKSKIKELNEKIKEAEKELRNKQIEDEIEALEKAQEEKEKQLEEEYNANVEAIEKEKEAKEEWYEKQLDDQNIYSEANKLLLSGNMNSMLELLRDYAPEWENIGILFGESMSEGLMRAIRDAVSGKQFMDGLKSSFEESKPSWEKAKAPGSTSNSNSSSSNPSNGNGKKGKVVGTSTLNVREGAGTNYKKSGILYKNEEIDILDEKNGWFYIEYYNAAEKQRKKGWSASNYIQRFNTGGLVGELGSLGGLAIVDSKERILTAQQTGAFDNFVYDWLPKIENIMNKFNNLKESSSIDSSSQVLNFYNTYNVDATSDFKVDKLASDVVKHIENKVRRSGVTLKPTARVFVRNN